MPHPSVAGVQQLAVWRASVMAWLRRSGHERKSGDVCGEEFAAQARREVLPHGHRSISRQWICKERATPPGPQRTAARRVEPHLAWGFVARRSQPHCRGMLPPRASPQAKWGATNVTGFTLMTTSQCFPFYASSTKSLFGRQMQARQAPCSGSASGGFK